MVFLKVIAVGPGLVIITVDPRPTDQLDKVLVTMIVLGKHNEVIARTVTSRLVLVFLMMMGHIHLASKNRLERFKPVFLALFVH